MEQKVRNIEQKIKGIMARVFGVPAGEIKEGSSAHTIPSWDSLKHIDLILELEKEFGVKFQDEEIPTMINYPMVVSTIQAHLE